VVAPARPTGALARERRAQVRRAVRIIALVARYYYVDPADLRRPDRRPEIVEPRQVAMYLLHELRWPLCRGQVALPYQVIARLLSRDNSTVQHGVAAIGRRIRSDPDVRCVVEDLQAMIAGERGWSSSR